jgi:hypothetical protein
MIFEIWGDVFEAGLKTAEGNLNGLADAEEVVKQTAEEKGAPRLVRSHGLNTSREASYSFHYNEYFQQLLKMEKIVKILLILFETGTRQITGSGSKLKYLILIQEPTDCELLSVYSIDRKKESHRGQMKKIIEFFKNHGGYARMKDFKGVDQFRSESGLPLAGKSSCRAPMNSSSCNSGR